ncbi:UNVERIFIED_CONTAM: hypothetical protein HDU68_009802 [Siphonaria sp. JEL0065]|nr:hypothetical protein HDU68_009802 [Siphonaria sp. JEL0065]
MDRNNYKLAPAPEINLSRDLENLVALFREQEGWTVIVPSESTFRDFDLVFLKAQWITLNVVCDFEAVGFTAACTGALTAEGISCNVVAAHLFVSSPFGDRAVEVLAQLSSKNALLKKSVQ